MCPKTIIMAQSSMDYQNDISPTDISTSGNEGLPVGAVMVVGGGIAGMQASLDLAEQGFKVHLIEKQSAIGGHMAQLDKTFPTKISSLLGGVEK